MCSRPLGSKGCNMLQLTLELHRGYEGRAVPVCDVDAECQPQLRLHGCLREEKCVVPQFDVCASTQVNLISCEISVPEAGSTSALAVRRHRGATARYAALRLIWAAAF